MTHHITQVLKLVKRSRELSAQLLVKYVCHALHCTALHCTARYCTVMYGTVRYGTVRYGTVRYCTVLQGSKQRTVMHRAAVV